MRNKTMINCNGKLLDLSSPVVMGILNITPDSFYDGGKYTTEKNILNRAEQIITEGAAIIDIGAYSTRPGAENLSEEEELNRLIPAVKKIRSFFPDAIISIDTFRSQVAKKMVNDFGADIINDISAGTMDDNMFSTIAGLKVPYIIMHMSGTPQTMQDNPVYENLIKEIFAYFYERIETLKLLGIKDIIIDPGFGFGKTITHNYELLKKLDQFKIFGLPLIVGLSRKSMIYKLLGITPAQALNGTTVLNTIALQKGATILRVHDVMEAVEAIKMLKLVN
jgi:dihydropteroate synthase